MFWKRRQRDAISRGNARDDDRAPLVRAVGIHKQYRNGSTTTPVLKGIDLDVRRGECAFLVGPSGSGKSTLLSILGCILSPDQGQLFLMGDDVARLDAYQRTLLRRDRIGFIFQRFQLVRGLNVLENVTVPLTLRGVRASAARRRAAELLEAVGMYEKRGAVPRNLSGGQCQRVAVARALAGDPQLILADEPTASLDAANGRIFMELLTNLIRQQQKTAIVVTHDPRIYPYADRICAMDSGRIIETPATERPADSHASPAFPLLGSAIEPIQALTVPS